MNSGCLLVSTCLVLSMKAAAQPAAPADTPAPDWSIGAGVNLANQALPSVSLGAPFDTNVISVLPGASALIERRLNPVIWIVVGVGVNYTTLGGSHGPNPTQSTDSLAILALSVGLRFQLTQGGPVDLSVLTSATAGYASHTTAVTNPPSPPAASIDQAFGVGVQAGLGLERMLTERLAARIAVYVLKVEYDDGKPPGGDEVSSLSVGLTVSPWVELRMYF